MLKNKLSNTNKFIFFVIFTCAISVVILLFSLFRTIYGQELNRLNFCLQSQCIDFFAAKITGVVALAQFFGWLITLIAALGGAIIALRTYVTGIGNSNITNHIAHFSMFRDFVNSEINKRKKISPDTIDIHLWYSVIFPGSKMGDLSCSQKYKTYTNEIKDVIEDANFHISTLTGKYKYQAHQRKMIDSLNNIGITINNGPKNIFIDMEYAVFSLVDSVNSTFSSDHPIFCSLERKYS
ncbi:MULTISPECIES: retron Ec48 family effector membrane protein [Pectobacterium]|uniref:retron Ec48 family effector membrane protein n=1 Tax=Pectobacterium TaxID=122277 RepID=UPI00068FC839|nr:MULTISPECIES: retron Ec48 family effector membrane protein [Pectobacterium]MCA6971720.1 retron Ec48 family effector membrane protein [Pectobacterium carotovorum]